MGSLLKVTKWFDRTTRWLERLQKGDMLSSMDKYGEMGVEALAANTPVDTGMTAASWDYNVSAGSGGAQITWFNSNEPNGQPIAIMLQYGHGTGTGGYVIGEDYINPAMAPVFDRILIDFMKEVTAL